MSLYTRYFQVLSHNGRFKVLSDIQEIAQVIMQSVSVFIIIGILRIIGPLSLNIGFYLVTQTQYTIRIFKNIKVL